MAIRRDTCREAGQSRRGRLGLHPAVLGETRVRLSKLHPVFPEGPHHKAKQALSPLHPNLQGELHDGLWHRLRLLGLCSLPPPRTLKFPEAHV